MTLVLTDEQAQVLASVRRELAEWGVPEDALSDKELLDVIHVAETFRRVGLTPEQAGRAMAQVIAFRAL